MAKTKKVEAKDESASSDTPAAAKQPPPFRPELLKELLAAAGGPAGLANPNGLLRQLTAALVNKALEAEMTAHLGYEAREKPPDEQANRRNGYRTKKVRSNYGVMDIDVPRDREGSFEPKLVKKHQRTFAGFDDKILSMYARGMSTRDIRAHLEDIYGVDVSPELISRVTDAVAGELAEWQSRPLDAVYPIVYIDALVVKVRDQGKVENKAVHVVVGVNLDGERDVLGLWLERTEGAKFWSSVLTELRERGVEDIFILCADGLAGLPQAVEAVFPKAIFQTCIVHLIRASTRYVSYRDLRSICQDLKAIYTAANVQEAEAALAAAEEKWGPKYSHVFKPWRTRKTEWQPFLQFPAELRHAVYTTNTIEALNRILRKVLKTRGPLPNDEAALKLLYLAIKNAKKTWGRGHRDWLTVRLQLNIHFEGRLPDAP